MNPFLKKEIRLLLPAWIAAMLLAVVPPWVLPLDSGHTIDNIIQILFSLGVLILGITSFGQEFNSGAISNLLAQPLDRNRIWRMKTVTLALAFLLVCFAACTSRIHADRLFNGHGLDALGGLSLAAIVTFSGGLWTTLLLRQMTGAFWFTLLIPAAIVMLITAALQASLLSDSNVYRIIVIFLVAYSIAGFVFARHLFLRAQDIQWTGEQITLFSFKKSFQSIDIPASSRSRHWLSSLFWKEIQLHQANILIAVLLLALNVASVCILKFHPRFKNPDITYMLEAVGILWLLMPLVIGSAAISEERRMGILDSHLCLPLSRRAQLSVKFLVALSLSLFLGGAMPLLMDHANDLGFWIFVVAAAIFIVSFYTSSFGRTTVQAIGLAIAICLMIAGLLCLQNMHSFLSTLYPSGLLALTFYVGSVIALLVFGFMVSWNFNWLHENGKLLRRNATVVFVAYFGIFALSDCIYFRVWELCLPVQSPSGPARISRSARVPLADSFNTLYIVTPDGRLWTETLGYDEVSYRQDTWVILSRELSRNEFIGGTNWVDVATDDSQAIGVQSDGTLWSIQRIWILRQSRWRQNGQFTLAKIGSDTNWSQAAGDRNGFLLLKKDGSLWTWGTREYNRNRPEMIPNKLRLDRAESPARFDGRDTFAEVLTSRGDAYARKIDGTAWLWTGWKDTNYICTLTCDTNLNNQWSNFAAHAGEYDYSFLGVKTNGDLFLGEDFAPRFKSRYQKFQFGKGAKWRSAAFGMYSKIWAIRDDGTLWQWPMRWALMNNRQTKSVQLGSNSAWVELTGNGTGLALAADGSLWAWDQPSRHIWLAPSRRPVYMGNIFGDDETGDEPATKTGAHENAD